MAVASVGIIALMFFFNYGKPYDWFHSPVIATCSVIAPLLLGAFLWRMTDPPNLHAYSLNVWQLSGYMAGAFICFWWFRWPRWRFRYLISAGMFCYFIYFAILYFGVAPYVRYEMFIMINSRSVLAPIIAISFFNNMQYRLQLEYVQSLSASVTSSDPLAAERYARSLQNAISQGHGFEQAQQVAVSSLDSTLQMQGLLLSVKDILGMMMVAALVVAVVSAFIPFHKAVRVKVVKTGEDMV